MTIPLTTQQINDISKFVINKKEPDYAGMYQYIFDTYGSKMDKQQSYWFKEAAKINRYLNDVVTKPHLVSKENYQISQSAYFIQQMNKESLHVAKKDSSDKTIQLISNTIAENVYLDIIKGKHIPDMTSQVNNDIKAAIEKGKLTVGEWGGAFYFWDMKLPATNNVKLGKYIVDNGKLDGFIAMTSISIAKTMDKFHQLKGDGGLEAFFNALKTFSSGYSDGLNPLAILALPNVPLAAWLLPQSDQWVGIKLLYATIQESIKLGVLNEKILKNSKT